MTLSFLKRKDVVYIGIVFLAFLYGINNWRSSLARDFYQFWIVGEAVRYLDVENIYSKTDRAYIRSQFYRRAESNNNSHEYRCVKKRKVLELAATPLLYATFYSLSTSDFNYDYEVYRIASILLFLIAFFWFCFQLEFSVLKTLFFLILFTTPYGPFKWEIKEANVNQIQLAFFAIYLWFDLKGEKAHSILAGFILFFSFMYKPNIAFAMLMMFFYQISRGRFRHVCWEILGGAGAVLVSILIPFWLFGGKCSWVQWPNGFNSVLFHGPWIRDSFLGLMDLKFFGISGFKIFSLILLSGPLIILLRNRMNLDIHKSSLRQFELNCLFIGLGILVFYLSSPMVHIHYLVLIIPMLLVLLKKEALDNSGIANVIFYLSWIFFGLICISSVSLYHSGLRYLSVFALYPLALMKCFVLMNRKLVGRTLVP